MFFFNRSLKDQNLGNTEIKWKHFTKNFDVANYNPAPYSHTTAWSSYIKNSTKHFCNIIQTAKPDDLCDTMVDAEIDAYMLEMKASAMSQLQYHLQLLKRHQGILTGECVRANAHLKNLREDLAVIQEQLTDIKSMRNNGGADHE